MRLRLVGRNDVKVKDFYQKVVGRNGVEGKDSLINEL